jgi:septal ring factor EnvC (AmiA/AmiB activator)
MARKPLRSQLNQIRAWVRQGRTDAWIAHQLDVPASELREFRRRHELTPEDDSEDVDLRDEIEAEIEALSEPEEEEEAEDEEAEDEVAAAEDAAAEAPEDAAAEGEERPRRRRRRRGRRGRGGGAGRAPIQATFDHGTDDGHGLWLDPAVEDDPIYAEHWAGQRRIEVTIEPDRIVIRRAQT